VRIKLKIYILLGFIIFPVGCATMLPSEKNIQALPWKDYNETEIAYKKVLPGETNIEDLKQLGFDLKKVSRAEEWNEIRARTYLLGTNPNTKTEDLPMGAQECLKAQAGCRARAFDVDLTETRGVGSFFKEKFGYHKKRQTTGSKLKAIFFYKVENEIVVFKIVDQQPFINDTKMTKDPLGPFNWFIDMGRAGSKMK